MAEPSGISADADMDRLGGAHDLGGARKVSTNCWFIPSMRTYTACADSSTASTFSSPMRANSRRSRMLGTMLAKVRRLRAPMTCAEAIAISPVFQASRLPSIHGSMNNPTARVEASHYMCAAAPFSTDQPW
jgi:hypothetical protein